MTEKEYRPKDLQKSIEQVAGLLAIRFRPMFGGIVGYASEQPFASLSDKGLALRLAEVDRQMLIQAAGRPLQYILRLFGLKALENRQQLRSARLHDCAGRDFRVRPHP